jgi:FlaA1/EpsC-like NDP-sugar epimerase
MRTKLKELLDKHFLPKWIILAADSAIVMVTFIVTYMLRYNLFSVPTDIPMMMLQLLAGFPFYFLAILLFKPHLGIIRHTTNYDAMALLKTHLFFSAGLFLISAVGHNVTSQLVIPWSVIVVHFFLSVSIMIFSRFLVQYVYGILPKKSNDTINIMIYGCGVLGGIARSVILNDNIHYTLVGLIDDNSRLWGSSIGGVKVYSPKDTFNRVINQLQVKEIVVAISSPEMTLERKREFVNQCLALQLKVKEFSDPATLLDGNKGKEQIRNIRIEDLLGREPIFTNRDTLFQGISGKRIMVTGGAGSIGSEIVRQLIFLNPQSIIIVDQAETAVFDIQNEIIHLHNLIRLYVYVADVTNVNQMNRIFERCQPQIIFHAAAYKHVPIMEMQPYEAIHNNVGGTKYIADLAVKFNVEKFVMISTDKAVNPSNIMGATKRICEIYIQSLSQQAGINTRFIITRFGNVLGSNGSVIPTFKKQISEGGPVTITHREIVRYFMTIPEACNLVLEACLMGKGGEIYLFDMGSPVLIYDLAIQMISLSGFIPHEEIKIEEIGLRPGEKLYEELLSEFEETLPTGNPKIMAGKFKPYDYNGMKNKINLLLKNLNLEEDVELVVRMKDIAPEYISKNSQFEDIDTDNSKIKLA